MPCLNKICPLMSSKEKEVKCKGMECAFYIEAVMPMCSFEAIARFLSSLPSNK